MDRRSFLKLGALFAAAMVVESSPALRAAANIVNVVETRVLLYLIQHRNGKWKVKATKYVDIAKTRMSSYTWNLETFKPLDIVDNSVATERRNELWVQYECTGKIPNSKIDVDQATRGGIKGGATMGRLIKEKNPKAIEAHRKVLRIRNQYSQEYFRNNPDAAEQRTKAQIEGNLKSRKENPEMWKLIYEENALKYSEWCKNNPDKASEIGYKRWLKSKEWLEANPELASERGRKGGIISGPKLREWLKTEDGYKAIMAGAFAGGAKSTERKEKGIQAVLDILPNQFQRLEAYDIAKQHGLPISSVGHIIKSDLVSMTQPRREPGSGRGGRTIIYTKI